MTPELKKLPPAIKPRNRTELSITNGFEFGIGFWLAGVFILFFGVPAIACAVVLALGVLGRGVGTN